MNETNTISIIGLGYVGLPLAVTFGQKNPDEIAEKLIVPKLIIDVRSVLDREKFKNLGAKVWRLANKLL